MNESYRWRMQAAEMREELAGDFVFIGRLNWELGHARKANSSIKKAYDLKLEADVFRDEAELYQTPTE
jgi:hypothetical protein